MEDVQCSLLGFAIEINETVPAGNQVQARKGCIFQQVMLSEQENLAYFTPDPESTGLFDKKSTEPLVADVRGDRVWVSADSGNLDCTVVEVATKNLEHGRAVQLSGVLQQEHPNRISLLAGGARWHPNSDEVVGTFVLKQLWDQTFKTSKRVAIAEEIRDRDEQILLQRFPPTRLNRSTA
jgi:hypothetical protein